MGWATVTPNNHAPVLRFVYGHRDGEKSECPWTRAGETPLSYDGYELYQLVKHDDGAFCGAVYVIEDVWLGLKTLEQS